MSTRGLIGFRLKGKDFVQYNHSDSYPTWLGKKILQEVRELDIDQMRTYVAAVKLVPEDKTPTAAQFKKLEKVFPGMDLDTARDKKHTWYDILRDYQGELARFVTENIPFWPDYDGFQHSFGCEWAYIVDLDRETLEIYTGHYRLPGEKGREYYPVLKPRGPYLTDASKAENGGDDRSINLVESISLEELREVPEEALVAFCERLNRQF